MTHSFCGGPSEPKPGFNVAAYFTPASIGSVISTIVAEPAAALIAAIVSTQAPNINDICAVDPVPDPGVGPLDLIALANPQDSQTYFPAVAKFEQWWLRILWQYGCQCTDVATPALPAPSNPGPAIQNPGLGGGSGQGTCFDATTSIEVPIAPNGSAAVLNGNDLLPGTQTVVVTPVSTGGITEAKLIPPGIQEATISFNGTGTGFALSAYLLFFDSTGHNVGGFNYGTPTFDSLSPFTFTRGPFTIPSGAVSWQYIIDQWTPATCSTCGEWGWTTELSYTCSTSPNTPVQPCCPPDDSTQVILNQLYRLVVNIAQSVAPAAPPTGWTDGVRHSSLRGAGSFLIAPAAIGVRFEFSTIPPNLQIQPGNPNFIWDLGFWTPYALTSPLRGSRLVFNPESFHLPDFTDQIGYTLAAGAVADAIELMPTTS